MWIASSNATAQSSGQLDLKPSVLVIWPSNRAGLGGKPKDSADAGSRPKNSSGDGSGSAGSGSSTGDALVPSGPERKHHKVFVVELSRKPLFPGIYTPVIINKNEALVKEILEVKRQGCAQGC